jgi:zinc protease
MTKNHLFLFVFLLFSLLSGGITLYSLSVQSPKTADRPFLSPIDLTTPSHIPVWGVHDHAQEIISLSFAIIGAGASTDDPDRQGTAQLFASLLDEGAGPRDSASFQALLADHSISLSFQAGRDSLIGTMRTLTRHQDLAFDLLKDAIQSPRLDMDAIDRMRTALQIRIKENKVDPDWQAARLFNDRLFDGSPYAMNGGGTLKSLGVITRDDLLLFKKKTFFKNQIRIAVVGDFDSAFVQKKIDGIFGVLPNKDASVSPQTPTPLSHLGETYLYERDIPQTILMMAGPAPQIGDADEARFMVMNQIYGAGGFGSRLMDVIREQKGLTYGIYTGHTQMRQASYLSVYASTQNEQLPAMIKLFKSETEKIKTTSITQKELDDAKGYLLGSMASDLTSTAKISNLLLAQMIEGRDINALDRLRQDIDAVSISDVQAAAQKWLEPDHFLTILVGNPMKSDTMKIVKTLPHVEE